MDEQLTTSIGQGDFERFRDFFYRKTGIYFDDQKQYFVNKRLETRIAATSAGDFRSYFSMVRFDPSDRELQTIVNMLTINETYFFREDYQFQCLIRSVLAEVRRRNRDTLRIWTIPCSTGEEPYTLALHLLEDWPLIDDVEVEIVASDISTDVLQACANGVYSNRSVQYVPPPILERHFSKTSDGRWRISDDLRASVNFCRVNLADRDATSHFRDFDVIFCRNLLIYFDDTSRREAVEALYDALRPGGFVFLGHSESMSRMSSLFELRKFPDAIAWQKPLGGER